MLAANPALPARWQAGPLSPAVAYRSDWADASALQARIVQLDELRDTCHVRFDEAARRYEAARCMALSGVGITVLGLATVPVLASLGAGVLLGGAATCVAGGLLRRRWQQRLEQCRRDDMAMLAQKMNLVDRLLRNSSTRDETTSR
ncbi:MAG: hypothetical protein FJX76_14580 [Armatimonadetes bacterium]|nr:hypothetical protein [Armatimonadota bacterium]